jgi:hypothetical protein
VLQLYLGVPPVRGKALDGIGALELFGMRLRTTATGFVSSSSLTTALFRAALLPDGLITDRSADLKSMFTQDAAREVPGDAHLLTNILGTRAPFVGFEDIAKLRRTWYEGHVYDFSTEDGLIITTQHGGVIVSNCRCERIPVPRGIKEMKQPKPNPPRKVVEPSGTGCE